MPNMNSIISSHNKRLLRENEKAKKEEIDRNHNCNCQVGAESCPLNAQCLSKSIVYKANVTSNNESSVYIGLASNTFKERYSNHQSSFNHEKYKDKTGLSKYIWQLKNNNQTFKIEWSIAANAPAYNPAIKRCHLFQTEKTLILYNNHHNLLNKKSELLGTCRHRKKHLLFTCS